LLKNVKMLKKARYFAKDTVHKAVNWLWVVT